MERTLLIADDVDFDIKLFDSREHPLATLSKDVKHKYQLSKNTWQHKTLGSYDKIRQEEYFCFSFVRNPWDLLVSLYYYNKINKVSSFSDMISSINHESAKKLFSPNGNLKTYHYKIFHFGPSCFINENIDFIGKFESLQEDFNTVCDKIGMPRQKLPHKNKSKHKHYTEYYDDETRQIVAKKYAKDIEYFGYEFGE